MKKMLMLVLVLAVASLANAGVITFMSTDNLVNPISNYYNSGTGVFTLTGTVDNDCGLAIFSNGTARGESDFTLGSALPTDASGFFFLMSDLYTVTDIVADATDGPIWLIGTYETVGVYPATGDMAYVTIDGATKVYVSETDGDGNLVGDIQTYNIPEPMTMALLGLGGLFLRRRK